jgi:hypothetical protein
MAERLDRAVVETLRYPARIAETNRHLVDDLLALEVGRPDSIASTFSGGSPTSLSRRSCAAVILSVGGFLGLGDKLVAVPVNQIKVGEAKFTPDLTKEQLANAPTFDFGKLK